MTKLYLDLDGAVTHDSSSLKVYESFLSYKDELCRLYDVTLVSHYVTPLEAQRKRVLANSLGLDIVLVDMGVEALKSVVDMTRGVFIDDDLFNLAGSSASLCIHAPIGRGFVVSQYPCFTSWCGLVSYLRDLVTYEAI